MAETTREEKANVLTHGLGALLSVAGLVVLLVAAAPMAARHVVASAIFGTSLVLLYGSSTLYHAYRKTKPKHTWKIIDHCCIYVLIAGTYTPFTLVTLHGPWGWSLFGVIWGLAVAGTVFKIFFVNRFNLLATIAYVLMGWIAIIALGPLVQRLPSGGIALLFAGGVFYTLGTLFYLRKRLAYSHAVWHLFVLGGSICHYFAILGYVVPVAV